MERLILIKNGVIITADFGNTIHKEGAILIGGNAIAELEFNTGGGKEKFRSGSGDRW